MYHKAGFTGPGQNRETITKICKSNKSKLAIRITFAQSLGKVEAVTASKLLSELFQKGHDGWMEMSTKALTRAKIMPAVKGGGKKIA